MNVAVAAKCLVVVMWCSCDMILLSFHVSNLLGVVTFASVNLLLQNIHEQN